MSAQERQKINLNELSERELLLLINQRTEALEGKCEKIDETNQQLMLKVNTIETKSETKSKVWGGIAGLITFIISIIVEKLLSIK